jgi:hypothetical protein
VDYQGFSGRFRLAQRLKQGERSRANPSWGAAPYSLNGWTADAGVGFATDQSLWIITTPLPGTRGFLRVARNPWVPVCCQGAPMGSACWCGPDGAGSKRPAWQNRNICESDVVGSGLVFADLPKTRSARRLAEGTPWVPGWCHEPMGPPACSRGGSPCLCGPGATRADTHLTEPQRLVDHHIAFVGASHGSLVGAMNPWVPLLVVVHSPRGVLVCAVQTGGTRHLVCQVGNAL